MSASPTPEARPYLQRLLIAVFVGIVLMASVATWAWQTYGKKLEEAPPLPPGRPPMHPVTPP